MKPLIFACFFLVMSPLALHSEDYRNTTEDMYRQTYAQKSPDNMINSSADIRAELYRAVMEGCESSEEICVKPFINAPTWQ